MTIWPGDQIEDEDGRRFTIERQVAYRGKENCTSLTCTRRGLPSENTTCFGWHCSLCDAPTSMMGHDCPRAPKMTPPGETPRLVPSSESEAA